MAEHNYRVKFTPKAEEDLDEFYGYILGTLSAALAADKLMDHIEAAIMRLKEYPFSCQYVLDEPLKARGYRKLIVDNYLVFYLVEELDKEVVIMRILYGATNYQDIL
ncbi:addiction module RelE/StbE family toxin [Anaerospora hongkongensis]|uniref:Addiction module RelE/StbE family toxin n=1 Tax=Anaerospora hongkongensis TaxID=244830 RepID=A0A4R1PX96_9FIRM|nr:type II toxin-antitoxin system RelE/ParE family toxin [Anaerospora hongkongensis]TCL37239.1 addiction module RelE/StbE family toxin [Anaerospora hongkongensis]